MKRASIVLPNNRAQQKAKGKKREKRPDSLGITESMVRIARTNENRGRKSGRAWVQPLYYTTCIYVPIYIYTADKRNERTKLKDKERRSWSSNFVFGDHSKFTVLRETHSHRCIICRTPSSLRRRGKGENASGWKCSEARYIAIYMKYIV